MQKFLLELQEKMLDNVQMVNYMLQNMGSIDGENWKQLYNANVKVCNAIGNYVKGDEYTLKIQRVKRGNGEFYKEVFELFNAQKIHKHNKMTDKMKRSIDLAMGKASKEEILLAIKRYGKMYHDKVNEYAKEYCNYKWTLTEFLDRGNGFQEFGEEGSKWIRYCEAKKKVKEKTFKFDVVD